MLLTAKVEYNLFSELDESITLIFIVWVRQKNLLVFFGELLVKLVKFLITYWKKIETVKNRYMLRISARGD